MVFEPDEEKIKEQKELADIDKEIDQLLAEKSIDPEFVKKHLPEEEYMDVELKRAEIKSKTKDNTIITEKALVLPMDKDKKLPSGTFELTDPEDKTKKYKISIYDTVFRTDLRTLVQSQFYECPSTVFPTIAERLTQTAINEKNAKFPEKRKDVKDYTWLIILVMMPFLIILAMTFF